MLQGSDRFSPGYPVSAVRESAQQQGPHGICVAVRNVFYLPKQNNHAHPILSRKPLLRGNMVSHDFCILDV